MKHLLILLTTVSLFNCQPQDVSPKEIAQFFLNGRKESSISPNVGVTESCERLIINNLDFENKLPVYSLSIELLKSGKLVHVLMQTNGGIRYETQPFNPEKYIKISNFKYDEQARMVSFDLNGILFMPLANSSIAVSGHFENLNVKWFDCNLLNNKMTAFVENGSNRLNVETLNGGPSILSWDDGTGKVLYFQFFTLSNSFRVVFESANNFKSLAVGTYKIGSGESIPVKVTFQEYKGLSNPANFYIYASSEWQDYRLDGTLTITNQIQQNGAPYTLGAIDFTAVDSDGKVVYHFRQGNFRLLNL